MRKRILPLVLTAAVMLCGCTSLLERSYNAVEPYTNRYWDTGAKDTLRAESYQDLVNSLLMLVEERAEEGIVRYYTKNNADAYPLAIAAKQEILDETVLGSYLLDDIAFSFTSGETYATLNYTLSYRSTASDPDSLMSLSDTQSLVDLLRLAVRENHSTLTSRFINPVHREAVDSAVESLWLELCTAEAEGDSAPPAAETEPAVPEGEESPGTDPQPEAPDQQTPPETEEIPPEEGDPIEGGQPEELPEEPAVEYPPCPWQIRFYPDPSRAEIVEILLD